MENISVNINDVLEEPRMLLKNTCNLVKHWQFTVCQCCPCSALSWGHQKIAEEVGWLPLKKLNLRFEVFHGVGQNSHVDSNAGLQHSGCLLQGLHLDQWHWLLLHPKRPNESKPGWCEKRTTSYREKMQQERGFFCITSKLQRFLLPMECKSRFVSQPHNQELWSSVETLSATPSSEEKARSNWLKEKKKITKSKLKCLRMQKC